MKAAFDPHATKFAEIYANKDFLCVMSCAGYRSTVLNQIVAFLSSDASHEQLGTAVLSALDSYVVVPVDQFDDVFRPEQVSARFSQWESDVCALAGYGSKRKLYAALKLVPIKLTGTTVCVTGTAKRRGAAFEGNGFSLNIDSKLGARAVGEAVLAALSASA